MRSSGGLKLAALIACSTLACTSGSSPPPFPPPEAAAPTEPAELAESELEGFYSAAQADRGRTSYDQACRACHPTSQFRGTDFEWKWRRQTAWELYREVVTNMPENQPGSLAPEVYADIVAYLLSLNDYQVGSSDLVATREALSAIPLGAGVEKTRPKE